MHWCQEMQKTEPVDQSFTCWKHSGRMNKTRISMTTFMFTILPFSSLSIYLLHFHYSHHMSTVFSFSFILLLLSVCLSVCHFAAVLNEQNEIIPILRSFRQWIIQPGVASVDSRQLHPIIHLSIPARVPLSLHISLAFYSTALFWTEVSSVAPGICWSLSSSSDDHGDHCCLQSFTSSLTLLSDSGSSSSFTCSVFQMSLSLETSIATAFSSTLSSATVSCIWVRVVQSDLSCIVLHHFQSPPPVQSCNRCSCTPIQLSGCDGPWMLYLLASLAPLGCPGLPQGLFCTGLDLACCGRICPSSTQNLFLCCPHQGLGAAVHFSLF